MLREQEHQRLQELGDFLRTRRARLAPEDIGLPRGSRRRAPGLRRAEVAQLAGVSVDWYTWLEQGRPITVSTQVLESLVSALCLHAQEREHLFFLAHQQPPPERAMEPETVSPTLQRFLDHQGLSPAFVLGRRWDVVAWNEAARVVFGDYGQMTTRERNAVWRLFTSTTHRHLLVNWEGHARRVLAQFRATCGRYPGDPRLTELIDALLLRSPEFRAWWPDHEVLGAEEGHKTFNHPHVGYLMFEHLTFEVFDAPDLKVNVYTPLDIAGTPAKLSRLLSERASVESGF
jgi:transcriptional regulator with XRE-family HTH domain